MKNELQIPLVFYFLYIMTDRKYSIVQIIDTLEAGGAEKVLVTLSNILFNHGHPVTVITTLQKGSLTSQLNQGIEIKELNRKSKWNLSDMRKLVQWCKPFDIIHVHSSHNLRYVYLAAKIFYLNKPIFFHHHYGNIETDTSLKWHDKIFMSSTILIAVSRKIYDWAIHRLKMEQQTVFLLPNIVTKPILQDKKNKKETTQIVLVSNFRKQKNITYAIDLMNVLKSQMNVHLTIIGQRADEYYCNSIKEKIQSLQLNDCISIQHDITNIDAVLQQYDLAIHTATSESGPLVLIEYMAAGLPFLSYQTGEVVHQIKNELPECIINNFETDEWIKKIVQLLQINTEQLSQRLQNIYAKYYSEEAYYTSCIKIYEKGLQLN